MQSINFEIWAEKCKKVQKHAVKYVFEDLGEYELNS
jgi:hypothetical protein